MRFLQLTAGAVAPHAPILLDELRSDETRAAGETVEAALRGSGLARGDLVVVVSPHGEQAGVYEEAAGSLQTLGVEGVEGGWASDLELAKELAQAWDRPVLPPPADHGVLVALDLLGAADATTVLGACLPERSSRSQESWRSLQQEARGLALALAAVAPERRATIVASVNTSVGLSPRAPLTEVPEHRDTERSLRAAIETSLGDLVEGELLERLWLQGSCAPGPLAVLGYLWPRRAARVLAYEAPVGVGYLVARIDD